MRYLPRLTAAVISTLAYFPAQADPVEDFYKGKTVTFISGYPPGGGYDAYARIFGRHFGKYMVGKPNVVVQSMPGAGSMVAANYIYNTAPPDGTAIGLFGASVLLEPLFGNAAARFEPTRFSWLGSMTQDVNYCAMWQGPGVPKTFDEMFRIKSIIGGGAPAALTYQHPMIMKNVLGVNIDVVAGYPGTREINLAMARGEVNGTCALFTSSITTQYADDVKSGRMKIVVQMGAKKMDTFGDIPSVFDYAKTDEQRQIMEAHFGTLLLARPIMGPPGIPEDRLGALRTAFFAMMKDPDFLAEALKAGIEIDPVTPEEVQRLLATYARYPKDILQKAAKALEK
jgi:tripartite-type tricarboxylate transporter receptor subunit TctC